MTNTLITRTFLDSDGIQQIAIFDTAQKPTDKELGLFIDESGIELIMQTPTNSAMKSKGKLILLGNCTIKR